jgi:hypothetical protein
MLSDSPPATPQPAKTPASTRPPDKPTKPRRQRTR